MKRPLVSLCTGAILLLGVVGGCVNGPSAAPAPSPTAVTQEATAPALVAQPSPTTAVLTATATPQSPAPTAPPTGPTPALPTTANPAPAAVPVRHALWGSVVGEGCLAHHAEGARWPEIVEGVEGVVTCHDNAYYFKPHTPMSSPANVAKITREGSPLRDTVVCYYGNRAARSMGVLGQYSLEEAERRLRALVQQYDAVNGERGAVPCFDYIYLVANAGAQPYAHYTPRLDLFEEALKFAEERNILFFVDLQLGYRDLKAEIEQVLPYLRRPNVHLALDTEFYMHRRGGVPGDTLGSMDAIDINLAQELLERFIAEHQLPDKILKVYQFDPIMLTNKRLLKLDSPHVHLLINADGVGYGGIAGKLHDYQEYAAEPANALGIKLFLQWDQRLLSPKELMALDPPPNQVVYQ